MNELSTTLLFSILAILIILSGFFSGSETALMTLNRYRLKSLADRGHKGARLAKKLLERPDRLLGLILLGNNIVNIFAATIATIPPSGAPPEASDRFGRQLLVWTLAGVGVAVLLVGVGSLWMNSQRAARQ